MKAPRVVVVGSGPGGSACAYALATAGIDVEILEAGPRYKPHADYLLSRPDWELSRFPEKVPTANRQTHAEFQPLEPQWDDLRSWNHLSGRMVSTDRRAFWGYLHVVGVGGSTLHYTGESHRLHPEAMRMRSRFGVAADWPITYADLESYYLRAERLVGVAGPSISKAGARPRSAEYPLPAHPRSFASTVLSEGCRKLGLSWTPNSVASLSRPYDGRPACNYCGQCTRGCSWLDKGTADLTFIAKALATGSCKLRTGCRVLRLEAGPNDRVKAAEYVDSSGDRRRTEADFFVVACGAIETPRLLLNSANQYAPEGIANESGLVGKHFMETLSWTSSALHPKPLGSHRGLPSDSICWDFNAPDAIPDIVGGCRFTPGAAEADLAGPVNYATRVVGGWGRSHKAAMRAKFGRVLSVGAIGENLPDPGAFIDLDPTAKDSAGLPKARIHAHLDETELHRLRFMAKTCRDILAASGSEGLFEEYGSYDAFNATHVFGTARMGTKPSESVVDAICRSHRWRNLLITDASVFPSSGGGESPSLTIYALALRAAEHLHRATG